MTIPDAYKSIYEALIHGGIANDARVITNKIDSEDLESADPQRYLNGSQGILIPGGFGTRGIEGKIKAVRYARENNIPFLGICLGMQLATIEFARNICGLKDANSTEFDKETKHPIISLLAEQKNIKNMGATMRLGAYPCKLIKGTKSFQAYKKESISERHRHRYEFNNKYRDQLVKAGLVISGTTPDKKLVEIIELKDHPFFAGSQFHPEFKSRPLRPHPLFYGFMKAIVKGKK
jgi:CTP synthase